MKLTTELTEDSQAVLSIEAEPEEMEHSMDEAYRTLVKKVKAPGFRKGKTPRPLLERYVGKRAFVEEAMEHLVPELYGQAVKESNIEPIADPHLEVLGVEPISFKATVPLKPTVELGDWRQVRIPFEDIEVTDEQIDRTMEQLRDRQAIWAPVDRQIQFSDMAVLDIQEEMEGHPPRGFQSQEYPVVEGSSFPLPGFAEEVVGMNRNDEKEFRLSFPEDTQNEELKGKKAHFKVKVLEVREKKVSDWSDELAKSIDSKLENVAALREQVVADMKAAAERTAKRRYEDKVIDAVGEAGQVKFPRVLIEYEIDSMVREQIARVGSGDQAKDIFLKIIGKTEEELRKDLEPMAAQRVRRNLVLGKVAQDENIQVTAAEIDAEIAEMSQGQGEQSADLLTMFQTPQGRRVVEQTIVFKKTVERLMLIASGKLEAEQPSSTKAEEDSSSSQAEKEESSTKNEDNG